VNVIIHVVQCVMVSLMVQSVGQKRGGGFASTIMHCADGRRIRDYERDCNTLPINGSSGSSVSSYICQWKNGFTI
jgi:hypothetical protein